MLDPADLIKNIKSNIKGKDSSLMKDFGEQPDSCK